MAKNSNGYCGFRMTYQIIKIINRVRKIDRLGEVIISPIDQINFIRNLLGGNSEYYR